MSEVEELREATREAHAAIKDMKAAIKEARKVIEEIEFAAAIAITERVNVAVEAGLARYAETLTTAMESATEAVYERFDTIAAILLDGKDRAFKKSQRTSILERAAMDIRKELDS